MDAVSEVTNLTRKEILYEILLKEAFSHQHHYYTTQGNKCTVVGK